MVSAGGVCDGVIWRYQGNPRKIFEDSVWDDERDDGLPDFGDTRSKKEVIVLAFSYHLKKLCSLD